MSTLNKNDLTGNDDFPWSDTGSSKGLAAMALKMRRAFIRGPEPCSSDIGKFVMRLQATPSGAGFVAHLDSGSKEGAKDEMHQTHSLLRWVDMGLPVFDLTHGLMSALLLTDPSDVRQDMVKPPFPTFVVRFPDGFWEMHSTVDNRPTSASLGILHIYEAYASTDLNRLRPMMSLRIVAKNGLTSTWETYEPPSGDGPVSDWLKQEVPLIEDPTGALVTPDEHDLRLAVAFRRLFINLCLYINENGRGERLGKPRTASPKKPAGALPEGPDIWVLGREVKLDRELMASAKAWTDSKSPRSSAREGWTLRERFTVRGHWRNQAHGPERSLRKMKWIAPYWKGEGPTFAHVYKPADKP